MVLRSSESDVVLDRPVVKVDVERTGRAEVFEDDGIVASYLRDDRERNGVGSDRRVGLGVRIPTVPDVEALRDAVDHVVLVRIGPNDT